MRALKVVFYLIEQVKGIFTRSNTAVALSQAKKVLAQERSKAMDASVEAKIQRIESSTGMNTKTLVSSILKDNNIKLRKELSSHE